MTEKFKQNKEMFDIIRNKIEQDIVLSKDESKFLLNFCNEISKKYADICMSHRYFVNSDFINIED